MHLSLQELVAKCRGSRYGRRILFCHQDSREADARQFMTEVLNCPGVDSATVDYTPLASGLNPYAQVFGPAMDRWV